MQKKFANDPEYAIELDENDNKISNQSKSPKARNQHQEISSDKQIKGFDESEEANSISYPDIKL